MKNWIKRLLALSILSALWGCGAGSSGVDADTSPTVTVGSITGFGSVIVNGTRFDDRNAVVTINDQAATAAELRVGMVVTLEGSVNACPKTETALCEGVATRIRFRNNMEGPITLINRLTNVVQVMGRDVVIDDSTVVEGTVLADINGLNLGDVVSVSGIPDQTRLRARWIERTGAVVNGTSAVTAQGVAANVDQATQSFTVDGVRVGWHGVTGSDFSASGLSNGQYVSVHGTGYANGLIAADRIQIRDRVSFPDASLLDLEGYVTDFVSVGNFAVSGQRVDASNAVFLNGVAADLKAGVKVGIEGVVANAVLLARKVTFRKETTAQIVAPIQSKETATMSLLLLGQKITTTTLTEYLDRSSGPGRPLRSIGYADLAVADRIDIRAYKNTSGTLVATRIERTEPSSLLIAKGAVDSKMPVLRLSLLGIEALTGQETRYRDTQSALITDVEFYGLLQVPPAVPSIVRVQGVAGLFSTSTIDASRTSSNRGEVELVP